MDTGELTELLRDTVACDHTELPKVINRKARTLTPRRIHPPPGRDPAAVPVDGRNLDALIRIQNRRQPEPPASDQSRPSEPEREPRPEGHMQR